MANTHTQTRASIDLGAGLANPTFSGDRNKIVRNHPPRLQHSPSLPNIWFPPHSGPIPPQIEEPNRDMLQRPASPPPPPTHKPSMSPSPSPKKVLEHRETLSFDDLTNYIKAQPLKIQMRRRIDRDHGHSLLTPPLTPSSSLRTATSIGSSNNAESDHDASAESQANEHETGPTATHFLLLGNISKTTPSDTLRSAIVSSLTAVSVDVGSDMSNNLSVPSNSTRFGPLNEDSIKGVFIRCQKSHGIVMLAFFDVRHAAIAKTTLATPSPNSPLAECIDDGSTEEGRRTWISCQFVTADELAKTIGNSTFLASVDGSFYISVEGKETSSGAEKGELRVVDDRYLDDYDKTDQVVDTQRVDQAADGKREINLTMLKRMLKSFGVLKSFSSVESSLDKEARANIFHLEYYDVREANAAYAALDGQVLFGMKLKVFGREKTTSQTQYAPEIKQGRLSPHLNEHSKNIIPFPSTTAPTWDADEGALEIGPPGHYSQIRERFAYPEPARPRPRSVSAGQHVNSSSFPPPPSFVPSLHQPAPSPTYFYTSPPVENPDISQYPQVFQGLRAGNNFFVDPTGRPYPSSSPPQGSTFTDTTHSSSFESPETTPNPNHIPRGETLNLHQDPGLPFYGPHHDCYYCPSRSAPGTSDRYYASYSTPSPLYYPQMHRSTHASSAHFSATPSPVPHSIPMCGPGYEYETPNAQSVGPPPNAVMTNWAFENAMIAASRYAAGDFWSPEAHGVAPQGHQSVPYHPQPTPAPTGYIAPYYPPLTKPEPQFVAEHHTPTPPPSIYHSNNPPALSSPPTRFNNTARGLSTANGREPAVPPERNQLNLAKIEDGQDTRTTVMVKNIPNKMSDKDLIAYIGKVCPRKIDFLYLRMDFQNGCNVGYAFVNFINVQDLLFFAKKKLGEKWNMFSSEKVLQMSYANYQGKEALVEKFKNSCIMDEREAWRPKIFYSDPGPEQGLPEPFPAPTHLRRKERSSFNRGALYVPGTARGSPTPQVNSAPLRRQQQNEEQRTQHVRHGDRERQNAPNTNGPSYPTAGTPRRRPNPKAWGTSGV